MVEKQGTSSKIWLFSLSANSATIARSKKILSDPEVQRAMRFVYPRDQSRFILARCGLRQILANYLDCDPRDVSFVYNAYGKPSLDPAVHSSALTFNLSHSRDRALLAVTDGADVGADIESIDNDVAALEIAQRYFCLNESTALENLPSDQLQLAFFQGWTRKEALLKALGLGLRFPLKDCEISLLPGAPEKIISVVGHPEAKDHWSIYSFFPDDNFVAAIVVLGPNDGWTIAHWKL